MNLTQTFAVSLVLTTLVACQARTPDSFTSVSSGYQLLSVTGVTTPTIVEVTSNQAKLDLTSLTDGNASTFFQTVPSQSVNLFFKGENLKTLTIENNIISNKRFNVTVSQDGKNFKRIKTGLKLDQATLEIPLGNTYRFVHLNLYGDRFVYGIREIRFNDSMGVASPTPTPVPTVIPSSSPTPLPTTMPTVLPTLPPATTPPVTINQAFPAGDWATSYGNIESLSNKSALRDRFRVFNFDADPGIGNVSPSTINYFKNNGQNKVLSYFNLGSQEKWRPYWNTAPGFKPPSQLTQAHRGNYDGYPDEVWMDLGNLDYQNFLLNYVAPRLVAQGVDGFYFDNFEIVEHSPNDPNGRGSASLTQGGLDFIYKLRQKYPQLLFVMQNATSDVTRLGKTNGVDFPSLLNGVAHESVFYPSFDGEAFTQMKRWQSMMTGKPFWLATSDYVGSSTTKARLGYDRAKAEGFAPFISDASSGQQTIRIWF
jgi:cysteinyl-tRNA synthetase, unknown class